MSETNPADGTFLTVLLVTERDPCILRFHNASIVLNLGGGPTEDKPGVTMVAPADPDAVSSALNVRVSGSEIRCYLRDPDGHLIEVGQSK